MKLTNSVSPEVYKMIKDECNMFLGRINYYKDFTEISNDKNIFNRFAIIAALLENISNSINE